jgi:2-dehydro-3-deoxygluconokinase
MTDLVTLGETLVVGRADPPGPARHATSLLLDICGAESNVAIGVRRLGHTSVWLGRVGDDEFGARILSTLRGERVDVSAAISDPDAPTAFMVKERRAPDITRVTYYRAGSAGSRLTIGDIDVDQLRAARILHVTGITCALGARPRDAVLHAAGVARSAGVTVSVDVNYRARLWPRRSTAAAVLDELAQHADILFASEDELDLVAHAARDAPELVITRGAAGASVRVDGRTHELPALAIAAVDPVGAGDAFAAGYLSAVLDGARPTEGLRRGVALGACAVASHSDWQGLPHRDQLRLMEGPEGSATR